MRFGRSDFLERWTAECGSRAPLIASCSSNGPTRLRPSRCRKDAPRQATEDVVDRRLRSSGGFALWEDGEVVSLSGFGGETPHGIRIGPVYTPPRLRRRGYASALVAQLSRQLLDEGRDYCFLYTDLANPTSNRIYMDVGYELVCESADYVFQ